MNIAKLPLSERMRRLEQNQSAHPELTASVILSVASTNIAEYMRNCKAELAQLGAILALAPLQISMMTYQDVAAYIADWYASGIPQLHDAAVQAIELMAAPFLREYQLYVPDEDFEEV